MSTLRDWTLQVRYPYTAGIIAVMWIGTAIVSYLVPSISLVALVTVLAVATLLIAISGFSKG